MWLFKDDSKAETLVVQNVLSPRRYLPIPRRPGEFIYKLLCEAVSFCLMLGLLMAWQAPQFKSMICSKHACTSPQSCVVSYSGVVKVEDWIMLLK